MDSEKQAPYQELTAKILAAAFDTMQELGSGFLETVYKNALFIALQERGLRTLKEQAFEVNFRGRKVGLYLADIVVEDCVIVELKCCKNLQMEHSAQVINYLKATGILVGLLINFGNRKLEYKRLLHPEIYSEEECIF